MPFVQSSYADQKPKKQEETLSSASSALPASTPIAEDPLTPAQIQEAIRIYRSVLSSSAPSSPVQRAPVPVVERPAVHSNYYGGGPTDIPQSYLLNYSTSPSAGAPEPFLAPPVAPVEPTQEQLLARLQALQLEQQTPSSPAFVKIENVYAVTPQKSTPQKSRLAQRIYDDEESGYCFNRKKDNVEENFGTLESHVHETSTPIPEDNYPVVEPVQQVFNYPPPANYSNNVSGPSEYIGMSNDNRFIYDAQKSLPAYTQNNSYTLVNAVPQVTIVRPEEPEDFHGTTTTEDVTQVPASPAVVSRFRGLIRNAQTPVQATAPIVVERVGAEPTHHVAYNNNNYGAFMPVNQMSMESEYQLPVLNDLASCIEHY